MTFSASVSPINRVLPLLRNVRQTGKHTFSALCPAHEDQNASLTVSEGQNGQALLHCHAGCETSSILAALDLEMKDLFPHADPISPRSQSNANSNSNGSGQKKEIVATYDYTDEHGNLLFQAVRFKPKAFRQRRPDGKGGHIWNLDGVDTVLYKLPEVLEASAKGLNVFVVEGEKDAGNIRGRLNFYSTCNPMGAGKWRPHYSECLRGAKAVIIPDKDEPGRKHAKEVARSLWGKAASIRILELPDREDIDDQGNVTKVHKVKDASDWIEAGGTGDELKAMVKAAPEWDPSQDPSSTGATLPVNSQASSGGSNGTDGALPEINASSQDLTSLTSLAWNALRQYNDLAPAIFRRGGMAIRMEHDEKGNPAIAALTPDRMRYALARCAFWYREKDGDKRPAKPPMDVIRDVLATPDYPLPILDRIVEVPVLSPAGNVCTVPGYQADAQVYYEPVSALSIPEVSVTPSEKEVVAARTLILDDLLGDFPFVDISDKANAVALFLLPFVRAMVDGPTPCHLVEAPVMGSGKSLLVEALLRPSLGKSLGIITEASDDDEWRKRLTAALRDGKPAIWVDNITRPLVSGAFAAALTTTSWTDRVLGESATATIPISCVWAVTGNNPNLSTEIARRSIRIRIDPKIDQPWLREGFRHPELKTWVMEERAALVWAALTIARAWVAAGKPKAEGGRVLGSYESWSAVLGGILRNAGIEGFLDNLLEFYEASDHEGARWRAFVETWWGEFQERKVTVADLFPVVNEIGDFDFGRGDERAQKISFGRQLMRQRDRVIGERRIVEAGKQQRARMWQLLPAGLSGPEKRAEQQGMFGGGDSKNQGNQDNVADKEAAATTSKVSNVADDNREPF